jgi:hypothetical protein
MSPGRPLRWMTTHPVPATARWTESRLQAGSLVFCLLSSGLGTVQRPHVREKSARPATEPVPVTHPFYAGNMANAAGELNQELSTEEAQAFLEDQTRRYLDMSLAEFYQRAEAGTLPDDPVVTHLVLLSGAHPGAC